MIVPLYGLLHQKGELLNTSSSDISFLVAMLIGIYKPQDEMTRSTYIVPDRNFFPLSKEEAGNFDNAVR